MRLSDLVTGTVRTLWAHKLRTALTMFGIGWGIVSITLMVAAGEGLRVGQSKVAENFGKNIMIVFGGRTSLQAGGTRAGRSTQWRLSDVKEIQREAPACQYVVPELGSTVQVRSPYNSASRLVVGSYPPFAYMRSIDIAEGRFYNQADVDSGARVAVLGSDAYAQLYAGRPALGETILLRGVPYTVIGLMRKKDQDSSYDGQDVTKVFAPVTAVIRDFPEQPPALPDALERIIASPKSLDESEECKAEIRRTLGRIHHFDPADEEAAGIWDTVEDQKRMRMMTDGLNFFLGAIGVVTLCLGGLGVMNVMLVAVGERTLEIGVRKAVGATRGSIVRQFFIETQLIVLLSGLLGMGVACGICAYVNSFPMPPYFAGLLPTWSVAVVAAVILGLVAILSALYPARRAASVDPIEALRHEAGG